MFKRPLHSGLHFCRPCVPSYPHKQRKLMPVLKVIGKRAGIDFPQGVFGRKMIRPKYRAKRTINVGRSYHFLRKHTFAAVPAVIMFVGMYMKRIEVIAEFKRQMCEFYGYDENLTFVGAAKFSATESKAFLEPRDFLNFAVEDSLTLDTERSRVNCLSNCKRAIDGQIDRLIGRLGFLPLARKQRWKIPRKLDFISERDLLAPRILRNINRLRNRLEHEFAPPSKRQVEDALDVATLFVSYVDLVRVASMNWTLSSKLSVRYDYDRMIFRFYETEPSDSEEETNPPLLSVAHGEQDFQGFYDFLMKIIPSMERKTH